MSEIRENLGPVLEPFSRERRMLLPALERVQEELGYLPLWALDAVSEHLRVPRSEVYGVATHYPDLRAERRGRILIRVCTGLSCRILGADSLLAALQTRLGLECGQSAADGSLTLEELHCGFHCTVAPLIEIDGLSYSPRDAAQAIALVDARLNAEARQ